MSKHNESDLPYIDAATMYSTEDAAALLFQSEDTLRSWRRKGVGPKYYQPIPRSDAKYRGSWLIEFRDRAVVSPTN